MSPTTSTRGTVVYVQYSNPHGYPPVRHSSHILAEQGWRVRLVGLEQPGVLRPDAETHPNITTHLEPSAGTGWLLRLAYLRFALRALATIAASGRTWVYVSDPLAAPIGLAASYLPGVRVVYHEHDAMDCAPSAFMRWVLRMRDRLLPRAELVVVPNEARGERLRQPIAALVRMVCVYNCPRLSEVLDAPRPPADGPFWFVYQGNLGPLRLPLPVIEALAHTPPSVHLRVIGYEVPGQPGYVAEIEALAVRLGVRDRLDLTMAGPNRRVPSRADLIEAVRQSDVGFSLVPMQGGNVNERHLVGASNKAFECLAQGLPLLVSDVDEWNRTFVDRGLARACNPDVARSVAEAMTWFAEHADQTRTMGEAGRRLVTEHWNYDAQFAAVAAHMSSGT